MSTIIIAGLMLYLSSCVQAVVKCRGLDGRLVCHEKAICHDALEGGVLCECMDGYRGDGVTSCTDVDECKTGGHDCDQTKFCHYSYTSSKLECLHTASCTNTLGGYSCSCAVGFTGDGITCTDIDECKGVTECSANAQCYNIPGSYHCKCNEGFHGDGIICTGALLDECSLKIHKCSSNSHCVDENDGYSCVCNSGYVRDDRDQCSDIDECSEALDECSADAECINTAGNYECYCHSGYEGDGLICTDIEECSQGLDSCSSLAECSNTVGSYECQCLAGYRGDGKDCSDINECARATDNCDSNADCINTLGSFQCSCRPGFTGDGTNCQDINECEIQGVVQCGADAVCENTLGSFQCVCGDGYQGDGHTCTQSLVDECALEIHECGSNSHCVDEDDGYSCVCNAGYIRDDSDQCSDINECEAGLDNCDKTRVCIGSSCVTVGVCSNIGGGFQCSCRSGFRGNGHSCLDIDECKGQLHDCDANAQCINTIGTFHCVCKRGYVKNGTSCRPVTLSDLCDKRIGYAYNPLVCQSLSQLYPSTENRRPDSNSVDRGNTGESGSISSRTWQTRGSEDAAVETTVVHQPGKSAQKGSPIIGPGQKGEQNADWYSHYHGSAPHSDGGTRAGTQRHSPSHPTELWNYHLSQQTTDSQQTPTYQEMLDAWLEQGQSKLGSTHHRHHSHMHRDRESPPPSLRLSAWPHPLTTADSLGGSEVDDVTEAQSIQQYETSQRDVPVEQAEDVWFRVPDNNIAIKQ